MSLSSEKMPPPEMRSHVSDSKGRLYDSPGFVTGYRFSAEELSRIRSIITEGWLRQVRSATPTLADRFASLGIERYHELSDSLDHTRLWTKDARLFSPSEVDEIHSMSLFKALQHTFGPFQVADIEGLGYPEIYWRLVRPGEGGDVADVHADAWFYTYTNNLPPEQQAKLIKVWVAICVEPSKSGLMVIPDSHKRDWPHHAEIRHGRPKPKLGIDASALDTEIVRTQPGDAVIFNIALLHGGVRHAGSSTRVSIEFAIRTLS